MRIGTVLPRPPLKALCVTNRQKYFQTNDVAHGVRGLGRVQLDCCVCKLHVFLFLQATCSVALPTSGLYLCLSQLTLC